MRDGASSFGLSIKNLKIDVNLNNPVIQAKKQGDLYHATKQGVFVGLKPKYRMKLLVSNQDDQESAETDIKMVVEREGEQVYLDI